MKYSLLAPAILLTACNGQWQGIDGTGNFLTPNGVPYVSASTQDAQYVSALEEAMQDFQPQPTSNTETNSADALAPATGGPIGKPVNGDGLTLLDEDARKRLNDALKTTPTGSSVNWQLGELTYTLAPNSPVYIPQHSGGNCRDAILTIYGDGFTNVRERALFCQSGPSADWVLKLK